MEQRRHQHQFKEEGSHLVCSICQKKVLNLFPTDKEGILKGKMSNGRTYSVRKDRHRYFFPDEWNAFIRLFTNKEHRFFFLTCLHTGGRIMEVLNLRYKDIDVERGTVTFNVVKQRKAAKNFYASGKSRGFFTSGIFMNEYKSFIRGKIINPEAYIFLNNSKLPENYNTLSNKDREKYYYAPKSLYSRMFKLKLIKAGIKDYYNFSIHNIRKTYGMWMRTFNIEMAELCYRMGHDMNTYLAHYGSSLIFTEEERRKIAKILGGVT